MPLILASKLLGGTLLIPLCAPRDECTAQEDFTNPRLCLQHAFSAGVKIGSQLVKKKIGKKKCVLSWGLSWGKNRFSGVRVAAKNLKYHNGLWSFKVQFYPTQSYFFAFNSLLREKLILMKIRLSRACSGWGVGRSLPLLLLLRHLHLSCRVPSPCPHLCKQAIHPVPFKFPAPSTFLLDLDLISSLCNS